MLSASAELDKSKKIPRMYNSVPSFSQHHRPPLPTKFPISQSSGSCSKSTDFERNLFPHNRKSCVDQFSGFSGYTKLGSGSSSEPGVWETAGWIPGASSNSKCYTISSERLTHSKSEKARRRLLTTQKDSSMKEKSKTKNLARSSDNLTYSGSPQWRKPSRERVVSPSKRTSQAHQSKSTVVSKRALSVTEDVFNVRLLDGTTICLRPQDYQTLGNALKPHMEKERNPTECVDECSERVIPWHTLTTELNKRMIVVREISGLMLPSATPSTPSGKKLERKGLLSGESLIALRQWFTYFAAGDNEPMTYADWLEVDCLKETLSSPNSNLLRSLSLKSDREVTGSLTQETEKYSSSSLVLEDIPSPLKSSENRGKLFVIESNWEDVVKSDRELTQIEKKKQAAIWEVFVTELSYLQYIRNILNMYMAPFNRLRDVFLMDLKSDRIFSNIDEVYQANIRLWLGYLSKAYDNCKDCGGPFLATLLEPGFMQIPHLFKAYYAYCRDLARCQRYIKHAQINNLAFGSFLQWADSMGHDHREPLWNQLARPFKRLMQYTLMLQNIRKYCTEQDELASVDRMHSNISAFVRTIDHQITNPDPQEKMLEKLVEKLQFPEYNENPGDGYQYFYDHYKRVSLLEDIELPAPILLTVPELKLLASSSMRDRGYSDVNDPNDFADITILSPMQTVDSPLQSVFPTRSSRRFVSRQYKDMAASCLNLVENVAPAAATENGTETSGAATQCECLHVKLFRCASRKTHESVRIYPSALERIRSTETANSWRRTVPRGICYQGALRFREGQGKWSNVKCFLLTDQLLITKANSKGYRVCRPPIRLDKLAFHRLDDNGHFACASLDDFHMIIALYTFMTTAAQSINWCSQLEYAQTAYQQLMRPEMLVAEPVLPKTSSTVSTGLDTGGIGASTNLNRLHRVNSTANLSSTPTETTQKMDPKRPTLLALCRNQLYNQSKNQVGPSSSNIQDHSPAQRSRLFGSTERGLVISDNRARSIIDMPYGRPESPSVSSRRVRNHQHFGVSIPVIGRTAKSHSLGSACKSHHEETYLDHRSSLTVSDEINAHIRRTGKLDADLSPANETNLTASCSTDSGASGMLHASPITPDQSDLHTGIGQDFNYSLQRNSESNSLNSTSSSIRSVSTSQPCQSSSDVDEYGESDVDLDWSSSLTPTNRASIRALRLNTLPPSRANLC